MKTKEGNILIVDDNEELLIAYKVFLSPHFGKIETLSNPNTIPSALEKSQYDVILLDMNFSAGINTGNEGFFWMKRILEYDRDASIIFITAYGDIELAIRAIREGATDFILKSWDNEKILSTILSASLLRKSKLEIRNLKSKQKHLIDTVNQEFDFCSGKSEQMKEIIKIINKAGPTDANILILGENGTGKEVLARDIHKRSKRSDEIFVSIDVGSISENIFESELFGHARGAYTDAFSDRPGRIEIASGGTLFLDEIGNLSLPLQAKLLSVIENKEVTRVGSNQSIPVDIRLICATNSNLYQMCEDGRFREDLLYRINTIQVDIPPLRQRQDDIPDLVSFFVNKFAIRYNKTGLKISSHAINQLSKQYWKGNIRELRNVIEKTVILSDETVLKPMDFVSSSGPSDPTEEIDNFNLEENEKSLISRALKNYSYNIKLTSIKLGINRTTLYNKIKKYGIESI